MRMVEPASSGMVQMRWVTFRRPSPFIGLFVIIVICQTDEVCWL